ncbi:HYC_CC_PP family protein [Reichenbachiella sp.]
MKKILSISLALIMLTTNMGFAVATHYCGGLAVESKVVLGHETLDCGMANMDKDCKTPPLEGMHLSKKPCCENKYQSIDTEDDFKPTIIQSTVNVEFVAAFIVTFLHLPISSTNEESQYANYSPPLIDQDISVLHQVFLI